MDAEQLLHYVPAALFRKVHSMDRSNLIYSQLIRGHFHAQWGALKNVFADPVVSVLHQTVGIE